jgi:hypothetical protein
MTEKKILISAYNINAGGGKLLLESILKATPLESMVYLFSDIRFKSEHRLPPNIVLLPVKNTIRGRIYAEWEMRKLSSSIDNHFCIGNLPPLFKSNAKEVVTLLHSRFLVDKSLDKHLPIRKFLVTVFERFWFHLSFKNSNLFIVQTLTMEFL